jgi:hypothetical protein
VGTVGYGVSGQTRVTSTVQLGWGGSKDRHLTSFVRNPSQLSLSIRPRAGNPGKGWRHEVVPISF